MNFDEYARTAVDLVNAKVETLQQARTFYGVDTWQAAEVTEKDVTILRRGAKRLREVFEHGSAGRNEAAVTALNSLLEAHPVQPRISFHRGDDWHMHVTSRGSTVGAEHMAGAVWGLRRRALRKRLPRHVVKLLPSVLLREVRHQVACRRTPGPEEGRGRRTRTAGARAMTRMVLAAHA